MPSRTFYVNNVNFHRQDVEGGPSPVRRADSRIGPTLGSHKGELPFQTRPPLPYALAALESHGAPAYVIYKVGRDPGDYQFFNELPKEVPHACSYILDSSNPVRLIQQLTEGVSGMDADKQAWLAKYATGLSHDNAYSAPGAQTAD
jgi:hypothetical protein